MTEFSAHLSQPPEIATAHLADVYLAGWDASPASQGLVAAIDSASMRAIGDLDGVDPDTGRVDRLMQTCIALVVLADGDRNTGSAAECDAAMASGLPIAIIHRTTDAEPHEAPDATFTLDAVTSGSDEWQAFLRTARERRSVTTPYAFFIGRLERDFRQARDAIRVAVEDEIGLPFLWADDGRHRTGRSSVREQTQLLIRHASLVIADLTLGTENPRHTNPSRAHEIGLATAYERPLILSSQEPRRVPYFSIGDLQMLFWDDEAELLTLMRRRLRADLHDLGRTIYNHRLPCDDTRVIMRPEFHYEASRRYRGPGLIEVAT